MRLAGIDIGTNSVRLLIADCSDGDWREVFSDRITTRLGEGFLPLKRIGKPAMERTAGALAAFHDAIRRFDCQAVSAVATSAVREAENRREFLDRVSSVFPFEIRVISGDDEAVLTWLGIRRCIPAGSVSEIAVDIGGGSTEWILAERERILNKVSLPLGAVTLTGRFLVSDPPALRELDRMRKEIRDSLDAVERILGSGTADIAHSEWIGTAGTVTTLAAMAQKLDRYDFERINGFVLTPVEVADAYEELIAKKKEERKKIKGVESGREEIIIAGAAILLETMTYFKVDRMVVSEYGLREGIVIDYLMRHPFPARDRIQ